MPNPSPAVVVVYTDDGPTHRSYDDPVLDTVLLTQLSGEFSGALKVVVNRYFHARDRRRVLVPRGSVRSAPPAPSAIPIRVVSPSRSTGSFFPTVVG